MRNILRDPGAEVVVGMASFAVSFLAIGLALAALPNVSLLWAIVFFILCAIFLVMAFRFLVILLHEQSKTQGYVRQIGIYIRAGRVVKSELLQVHDQKEWTEEVQNKVPKWKVEVQHWLDDNLPDYASQFDLEGFITTLTTTGVYRQASNDAEQLESRMVNLKEILQDIRR